MGLNAGKWEKILPTPSHDGRLMIAHFASVFRVMCMMKDTSRSFFVERYVKMCGVVPSLSVLSLYGAILSTLCGVWFLLTRPAFVEPSTLMLHGVSLLNQGRPADAILPLRNAIALYDVAASAIRAEWIPSLAEGEMSLARALARSGNASASIPWYERALVSAGAFGVAAGDSTGDTQVLAIPLEEMGEALLQADDARRGRSFFARALKLRRSELKDLAVREKMAASSRGGEEGTVSETTSALEIAVDKVRSRAARLEGHLATSNQLIGDTVKAIKHGRAALAYFNDISPASSETAHFANLLSISLMSSPGGEFAEEAETLLNSAVNAYRGGNSIDKQDVSLLAHMMSTQCGLLLRLARPKDAIIRCKMALQPAEASDGAESLNVGKIIAYTAAAYGELKLWKECLEAAIKATKVLVTVSGEKSRHVFNSLVTLGRAYEALKGHPLPKEEKIQAILAHAEKLLAQTVKKEQIEGVGKRESE